MKKSLIALILGFVFLVCGCSSKQAQNEHITIGVLLPLTGTGVDDGLWALNGLQLAKNEINAKGGVLGKKLDMIVLNDRGDKDYILQQYYALRDSGAAAIIGSIFSDVTLTLADAAEKDGVPLITPTASNPDITKNRKNVFRTIFVDEYQAQVLAYFIKNTLKAQRTLILYNRNAPDYRQLADDFETLFVNNGGTVVAVEPYSSANDFPGILRKYRNNRPDAIFCPDDFFNAAGLVNSVFEAEFTNTHLVGSNAWDGLFAYVYYPWAIGNVYYPSPFSFDDEDENVVRFVKNYFNTFSQLPLSASAVAYTSLYIVAEAIQNAGNTSREDIVSAMKATDMETMIGHINFDENNNPHPNIYMLQILGGVHSTYEKLSL